MKKKVAIVGRPRVGKTTLAKKLAKDLGIDLLHTDDLIGKVPFTDVDKYLINQVSAMDEYIVEGVQVARMLRTGDRNKSWKPDKVYIVDADIHVESKHKGLASLCKNPVEEWIKENPDVEVERVYNTIKGDR
jgi:cytidylate kinase